MQNLEVPMLKGLGHTVLRCLHLNFAEQAQAEVARRNADADDQVMERFSRGSVGLQTGRAITQEDIDREKSKLHRQLKG